MKPELSRGKRIALGLALPLLLGLFALYEALDGKSLPCLFYRYTGLYCPGCGSGRAMYALLRGRFREALGYNILFFVLGPPACVVALREYCRLVFPRLKLRPVFVPQPVAVLLAAIILLFWLLRNIPLFSFLAPA